MAYVNGTFDRWSNNSQISIGANGDASGISAYHYYDSRLGQWLGCDQNPNRGEGQYDMYFRAVDGVGNIGPQVGPYHCYFDGTAPWIGGLSGEKSNASTRKIYISGWVADNLSGVTSCEVQNVILFDASQNRLVANLTTPAVVLPNFSAYHFFSPTYYNNSRYARS